MGTKILLLTNDRKRLQALGITGSASDPNGNAAAADFRMGGKVSDRDLASEEALAELHNRVSDLDRQNKQLREKVKNILKPASNYQFRCYISIYISIYLYIYIYIILYCLFNSTNPSAGYEYFFFSYQKLVSN